MSNAESGEWRAVCQAAALAQSETESRRAWGLADDAPIPFNHRWEHVALVTALALQLGRASGADGEIVEAAAWLHDVRKEEPSHGLAGARAARAILQETDFPAHKIEAVCEAIRLHVGLFRAPDAAPLQPTEAAVLWDADKLSKLGIQAIMASVSSAPAAYRTVDERWRYVAEFVEVVLSRTVASMNTPLGRQMAEHRYRNMLALLSLWAHEARETGVTLQTATLPVGGVDARVDFDKDYRLEIPSDYAGLSQE